MIKYRIFTSGNIFYLIDIEDDNRIYEGHKKDILIKRNFDGDTTFFIYKLDDWDITRKLTIGELEDADNVAYTLSSFVEFFDKETGNFNSASGGSGAKGFEETQLNGTAYSTFLAGTYDPLAIPFDYTTIPDSFLNTAGATFEINLQWGVTVIATTGEMYTKLSFAGVEIFASIDGGEVGNNIRAITTISGVMKNATVADIHISTNIFSNSPTVNLTTTTTPYILQNQTLSGVKKLSIIGRLSDTANTFFNSYTCITRAFNPSL